MRIYLVRHGETDLNQRKCYYGISEGQLTKEGRDQAIKLGNFLKDLSWEHIVVSPLQRALETAELLTGKNRQEFQLEVRLKEQNFGIFEQMTYQEICQTYPKEMDAWNADFSHYCIPQGESFSQVRQRVEEWVSELPKGKGQMLVVAHKGTMGHMLAAMLGLPLEAYWNFVFEQGCYSVIDLEDGYAILRKINQSVE